ncbi:MAG: pyridoxamine 5'-phosphate oxidase family protein [Candidatus Nanopelagicales bacterium]|nr:pyridoxamine 5'-phosphate oxidase family protein [Candidatus Nanopelagicales bacterium]
MASTATTQEEQDRRDTVLELARGGRLCMLTVHGSDEALQARPMTPLEVTDAGEIWFLIDTTSTVAHQIQANPEVNLAFEQGSAWLSISGRGKVLGDPARVEQLWSAAAEAWFPDGPEDPRLGVLRVRGRTAQYWSSPGGRIATVLSFVKAKATGERIEADNETVRLR